MLTSFLIAFCTLFILIIMGGILAFYYFYSAESELNDYWLTLLDDLHLRLDKIPNLLETVKALVPVQEDSINELIRLRGESWKLQKADRDKVYKELAVSEKLHSIFALAEQFPALEKDTNFLALKMEFKELNAGIEKSAEIYNERVRRYNKMADMIFLRPLLLIFRFSRRAIFEYEA
jgi:LemA protein